MSPKTRTKVQNLALKKLEKLRLAACAAAQAHQAYKAKLAEDCDHPEEHRGNHPHSKSNGFGRWTTEQMPYCGLCHKVQYNSAYGHKWGPIPVNNYED